MNTTIGQKTKTGLFVIISLALLLGLIFFIGKQKKLFGDTFMVYADFKNISGTREGNFVRFAGINIGTVEGIRIINDTSVELSLSIEKKIQPFIKSDAVASIGSDGLMGDKLVLIAPGTNTSPVAKNGARLLSTNPVDVDKIMNNISKISANASVVTDGLADIVEKINSGKGTVGRLLADNKLADRLENTIETAKETAASINKTSVAANETLQAAKGNFLLRGYFKKKEKQRIKDSTKKADKLLLNEKKNKE
jgi:phospholipid/cholesterol/gamma-HCH transport system substrate-binding protein